MKKNLYPLKYDDFLKAIAVGNYTTFYAILDDRIHIEMPIENAVFCTQKFHAGIADEANQSGDNYSGDSTKLFIRRTLGHTTAYRFYPTEDQITEYKKIKLYKDLIVQESKQEPGQELIQDRIVENDNFIKTYKGDNIVLIMEKI